MTTELTTCYLVRLCYLILRGRKEIRLIHIPNQTELNISGQTFQNQQITTHTHVHIQLQWQTAWLSLTESIWNWNSSSKEQTAIHEATKTLAFKAYHANFLVQAENPWESSQKLAWAYVKSDEIYWTRLLALAVPDSKPSMPQMISDSKSTVDATRADLQQTIAGARWAPCSLHSVHHWHHQQCPTAPHDPSTHSKVFHMS